METSISSGARQFLPGPALNSSTGTLRLPRGPTTVQTARLTIMEDTESAAGDALQRLPPALHLPCTWLEPIRPKASTKPG